MNGSWPEIGCVHFKNPYDVSRYIFFWSCATHSMKSTRNNLFYNQPTLARNFFKNGVHFWVENVKEIWMRDKVRVKSHKERKTNTLKHAATLENCTLMNSTHTNQPFTEKSISEAISFLSVCLLGKMDKNMKFKSKWHKCSHMIHELSQNISLSISLKMKDTHAMLEYQIALYGLFVKCLLNRK